MAPAQPASPVPAGATPPHSIEAEQAVLGAILLSEKAHYTFIVEQELTSADFYRGRHRVAFEVMADLFSAGVDLDVLSVTEELKARGKLEEAGGADEIAGLVTAVPAVGNLRRYAQIVKDLAHLRRLLDASYRIQSSVFAREGEPADIVDEAERAILDIRMGGDGKDFRPVGEVLEEEITRWQKLADSGQTHHRRALRLRGPRHDHRRLPARQPDHPRRAPVDGQVGARHEHRRERRARQARSAPRRAVLARDVRGRARPALRRLAGVDQGRRPAQGQASSPSCGSAC